MASIEVKVEGAGLRVRFCLSYLTVAIAGAATAVVLPGGAAVAAPTAAQTAAWSAVQAPLPSNADSNPAVTVYGISCPSVSTCVAGGTYIDTAGDNEGLLLTLAAGKWKAAQAPLPSNAAGGATNTGATVYGISCPSASSCVAGGTYFDTAGYNVGLLLTLAAGKWKAAEAPLPQSAEPTNPGATIRSVSCASTSSCAAAGNFNTASGIRGQLLTLTDGKWHAAQAPVPANAAASDPAAPLYAMSCPSTSSCVAGGTYDTTGGQQGTLLTLAAGKWKAAEAPLPPGGSPDGTTVAGVSCASVSACAATGSYARGGAPNGLLLTRSGGTWTAAAAPQPGNHRNPPYANSYGISCPAASACAAVGSYTTNTDANMGMLLTLAAGKWQAAEAPVPANIGGFYPSSTVYGVSCASASACAAVGTYTTATGNQGLLLTRSGGI